ncbi:succinate dehydrogenase assembly factor 2 [Roseibaca sp. V10]|uniref:FAD assembly factor SdhE n=1 Tax=Roseinatronobacter domitianus TaxID=2940293 RepID=A0ABT0LZU1_9RHOB|nr:succinate dehydrogenase assembly factor 2 [Roseibaca domitiana]MCL1628142.1 succinate dehydrogenase assembly factor 2 [Roseibaca domitiana]
MQISPEEARLKRLKMRSWRRGMKEMDLILGPFSDTELAAFSAAELDAYERLLDENDQDLYLWVTGAIEAPRQHAPMLQTIRVMAENRLR